MKQASERIEQAGMEAGSGPEMVFEVLDVDAVSARIEGGLLMVFGPEGDPLPSQVLRDALAVRPEARLRFDDGHQVSAARVALVLEAQSRQRLVSAEGAGDGWLRAMLGLGPQPEPASAEELAAEGCAELTLFGRELLVGAPDGARFLLRARRPDDEDPGLLVRDVDGACLDHDALIGALHATPAVEKGAPSPGCRFEVEPPDLVVIAGDGRRLRLSEGAPGEGGSILCTPGGEAARLAVLLDVLAPLLRRAREGQPAEDGAENGSASAEASGAAGLPSQPPAGVPAGLELDRDGLLDLGWLAAVAEQAAPGFASVVLSGLPDAVRPSAGRADGSLWRVPAGDVVGLTMLATPEGLAAFTLEIRIEGGVRPLAWSLPVAVSPDREEGAEGSSLEPVSVDLDFPPPFSVRNHLEYFTLVMIEGLPPGATLSAGVPDGDGRWTLAPEDLRKLRAHLPARAALPCRLSVTGVTIENRDGLLSTASRSLLIDPGAFDPRPDGPPPAVAALDLGPLLGATGQGQRIDAIALSGLPPVVELSPGTFDPVSGCWVLRREELGQVEMIVRDPALRRLTLKAKAVAIDEGGGASAISRTLEVEIPATELAELEHVDRGPGFFRTLAQRRA